MKVLDGYGDKFEEIGTVRVKDGKIVYDLPDWCKKIFGKPRKGETPEEFMATLRGRFAMSSTTAFELEEGEKR